LLTHCGAKAFTEITIAAPQLLFFAGLKQLQPPLKNAAAVDSIRRLVSPSFLKF